MTLADDLAALIAAREAATAAAAERKFAYRPMPTAGYYHRAGQSGEFRTRLSDGRCPRIEACGYQCEAGMGAHEGDHLFEEHEHRSAADAFFEAHGAELAALVAENARLRAIIEQRFLEQGDLGEPTIHNTVALAVDDIMADLGVPMTDTVGGG